MTRPFVLTLSTVESSDVESPVPEQSDSSSCHSFGFQDTILVSSSDENGTSHRSKPWPAEFEIPTFSYDVEVVLKAGNQAYKKDGTLLNNPRVTSSILVTLG